MAIMERYPNVAQKGAGEAARKEVEALQGQIRAGLQSGSIRLHHYDTPSNRQEWLKDGASTMMALAVFAGLSEADAEEVVMENVTRMVENESYFL